MSVIYEISVNVIGVKKRCRKSDRHSLKIAEIDFKELSSDDVEKFTDIAKEALRTNMKAFPANAVLQFTRVKFENDSGVIIRQMMYPDPANKSFNIAL